MTDIAQTIQHLSIMAIPVLFAITLHEAAHGWVADKKGDPTARLLGRLTLNPIAHIDPVGTILLPILLFVTTGFIIGYAKPVPVNHYNLRRPKEDMIWVAGAGPGINLAMAVGCGILFRVIIELHPKVMLHLHSASGLSFWSDPVTLILIPIALMLLEGVKWNVLLAMFNMLPIPPLDGGRVMVGLLPDRQSDTLARIEPYGFLIVTAIVFLNPLGFMTHVFYPIMMTLSWWIVGINPFFM
jgi:Zn-dependent protease